jgi:hypothetical protein
MPEKSVRLGLLDQPLSLLSIGGSRHQVDLSKRAKSNSLIPTDPHGTEPAWDAMSHKMQAEQFSLHLIVCGVDDPVIHSIPLHNLDGLFDPQGP